MMAVIEGKRLMFHVINVKSQSLIKCKICGGSEGNVSQTKVISYQCEVYGGFWSK